MYHQQYWEDWKHIAGEIISHYRVTFFTFARETELIKMSKTRIKYLHFKLYFNYIFHCALGPQVLTNHRTRITEPIKHGSTDHAAKGYRGGMEKWTSIQSIKAGMKEWGSQWERIKRIWRIKSWTRSFTSLSRANNPGEYCIYLRFTQPSNLILLYWFHNHDYIIYLLFYLCSWNGNYVSNSKNDTVGWQKTMKWSSSVYSLK